MLFKVDDDSWLSMNLKPGFNYGASYFIPDLPSDEIQLRFTGRTSEQNLLQAFDFYKILTAHIQDPDSTVVDFGGGWGRITRFLLRDIYPSNLYLVDCLSDAIETAKSLKAPYQIDKIEPMGNLAVVDNSISMIYAFSVFSHLSEAYAIYWLKEFSNKLKLGGKAIITTRGKWQIEYLKQVLTSSDKNTLAEKLPSPSIINKQLEIGKFQFYPTGGGGELDNSFYGETWIPEAWIASELENLGFSSYVYLEEHKTIDQSVFILTK